MHDNHLSLVLTISLSDNLCNGIYSIETEN